MNLTPPLLSNLDTLESPLKYIASKGLNKLTHIQTNGISDIVTLELLTTAKKAVVTKY